MKNAMEMKKITKEANEEKNYMFKRHIEFLIHELCEEKIEKAAKNGENNTTIEISKGIVESETKQFLRGEKLIKEYLTDLGYFVYTNWEINENGKKINLILSIGW